MTRFMRFWLRLGLVLAIPLLAVAVLLSSQSSEDLGFVAFVWAAAVGMSVVYLGVGWAINAFFRPAQLASVPAVAELPRLDQEGKNTASALHVEERAPAAPVWPLWLLVGVCLSGVAIASSDMPRATGIMVFAYAIGHVAGAGLVGVLLTRYPRKARPYWPAAALAFSLIFLAVETADDRRIGNALDELDRVTGDAASTVRDQLGVGAPLTEAQLNAAVVRATSSFLVSQQELGEQLAADYGVAEEPDQGWLQPDYYATPSRYTQVADYFLAYGRMATAMRAATMNETQAAQWFREAAIAAGITDPTQLDEQVAAFTSGYRRSVPSQDTTYQTMLDYADAAVALHASLMRIEGSLGVDANGELVRLGSEPIDEIVRLEDRITLLANELTRRLAQGADILESLGDSMRAVLP